MNVMWMTQLDKQVAESVSVEVFINECRVRGNTVQMSEQQ